MGKLELLKCPSCGNLPDIYEWSRGCYCVQCTLYACNFPFAIFGGDPTIAIEAWNKAVNEYKGEVNNE